MSKSKPPKRPNLSVLRDTSTEKEYTQRNSTSQKRFAESEAAYRRKVEETFIRDFQKAKNSAERIKAYIKRQKADRVQRDKVNQPGRVKTLYPHKLPEIKQPLIHILFVSRGYDHLHAPAYLGKPKPIGPQRIKATVEEVEKKLISFYLFYGWYHIERNINPEKREWFKTRQEEVKDELCKLLDTLHGATDLEQAADRCITLFEMLCNHLLELAGVYETDLLPVDKHKHKHEAKQIHETSQEALTQLKRTMEPYNKYLHG